MRGAATILLCLTAAGCDSEGFGKPTDVTFLSDGRAIVTDGYDNARVARFDLDRQLDLDWGSAGCEHGQFDTPHGVTADADDRIYVADRGNARVQIFDTAGALLDVWDSDRVGRPWGIEHHDGVLYVVDGGDQDPDRPFGRVVLLTPEGSELGAFGSAGTAPGQFLDGHDVAVDSQGAVYVAELIGRRVQKFVPMP